MSNLIEQARIDATREMYERICGEIELASKRHGEDPEIKKIAAAALIKVIFDLIEDDVDATAEVIGIFANIAGGY